MENEIAQKVAKADLPITIPVKTFLLLLIGTAFWGSGFPLTKIVMNSVTADVAAFFRFGIGALVMVVYCLTKNKTTRKVGRGNWQLIILAGFIGVTIFNLLLFTGLHFANASDGSIIIPILSPVITVILASFFLHEKLRRIQVIGIAVALFGTVIFFSVIFDGSQLHLQRFLGILLLLGSALCWAIYTILGKRLFQRVDPLPATAYGMLIGSLIIGLVALPNLITTNWGSLNFNFWLINLYLAVFPTVLAYLFYNNGVKEIGGGRASVFMFFVPISGLIVSALVLYEIPTIFQVIGALFMIIGVYIVNVQKIPMWGFSK
ncbi:hypothetical protein BTR23_15890 [Alkalihalophilus pseudofirmus]|nr:hypothetical protein BTR23_15890 [Alkalihalophilus pseudofirmus]